MNHIALVVPTIDRIGGAERQVLLLARGLRIRGWQVTLIALSGSGGNASSELTSIGIHFLSLGMRKGLADPRGWIRFHNWMQRARPDVLHTHLPHATWLARWSRLTAPCRAVIDTIHSPATGTPARKLGYRLSNRLSDRITAVSPAAAASWLSQHVVHPERLSVLPNGVDTNYWKPDPAVRIEMRERLGIKDEFVWLSVGRLEPVKDHHTLLRAIPDLSPNTKLVIAGAGRLENDLRKLSFDLGLNGQVRFLGFERGIRRWMQAADAFVLTSLYEGLPMALLEASSCGLPAVVSDIPGANEIIGSEAASLKFAVGDTASLMIAMTELMQMSPSAMVAMVDCTRNLIQQQFSLERILDSWEALYCKVLQTNPTPRRWAACDR
jgi:glycosyltransferase involved in cell wall biosynthesis